VEYALMDEIGHSESGGAEERGVFGNLPRSRPGVRSPRRRGGEEAGASEATPSRPSPPQRPAPPPKPPPRAPEPEAPPAAGAEGGGVEELAWAGITVAAEAATLGVRLLSRALEAVRKPPDRR
jgi:hypothetical protein